MSNKNQSKRFSEGEKCTLQDLVLKYQHVLENKKTHAVSNARKKVGWESVVREFNAHPDCQEVRFTYFYLYGIYMI